MSGSSHTCWHRRSPRHSLFRSGSGTLYGDCFISVPVSPPGGRGPGRMTLIFWKQSVQYWSVGMSCLWHGLIYCTQEGSLFPVIPELIALTFPTPSCHDLRVARGCTGTEEYMCSSPLLATTTEFQIMTKWKGLSDQDLKNNKKNRKRPKNKANSSNRTCKTHQDLMNPRFAFW